jgi:hypothetical protein
MEINSAYLAFCIDFFFNVDEVGNTTEICGERK